MTKTEAIAYLRKKRLLEKLSTEPPALTEDAEEALREMETTVEEPKKDERSEP